MTQPYTVHGLSYKYDSALDFQCMMHCLIKGIVIIAMHKNLLCTAKV